jgi:hypothetical protein
MGFVVEKRFPPRTLGVRETVRARRATAGT